MITFIAKDQPQYKANLHCHSVHSDGKLTPAELKAAYKDHGYSILAITDHEVPHDYSDMTEKDFLMLTGYEAYIRTPDHNVFSPEIHIGLLSKQPHNLKYINYDPKLCKYLTEEEQAKLEKVGTEGTRTYSVEYINSFVKTATENGYLCSYNHPAWSLEPYETISQYRGFFSMEMYNHSSNLINCMEYNAQLYNRLLREGKKLYVHSADDNHNKSPFDSPECDSFGGFTMILSRELTYPSVIEALEKGDFYSSMGPIIRELTFDGNHVHIETSPAKQITMLMGGKGTRRALGTLSEPVTCADFEIPSYPSHIRLNVVDFEGKCADTRAFFRDELEFH